MNAPEKMNIFIDTDQRNVKYIRDDLALTVRDLEAWCKEKQHSIKRITIYPNQGTMYFECFNADQNYVLSYVEAIHHIKNGVKK